MPTKTAEPRNGNGDAHPEALALGDPTPPVAQPLILNDAYFELVGTNLRCLVKHLEIAPENKPVTITSAFAPRLITRA